MSNHPSRFSRGVLATLLIGPMLAVLPSCTAVQGEGALPPSELKPAVSHPHDRRIEFRDEESQHVIFLNRDGTYQFDSMSLYGEPLGTRSGRWGWKQGGSRKAELTLDTDRWVLTFVSPEDAVAVNLSAPGRTRVFHFEQI